jgi:hypothetical protein
MESSKDAAILSFIVFFKISFVDGEQTWKWSELVLSELKEWCEEFFIFIENNIGNNLGDLIAISDVSLEVIEHLLFEGLILKPVWLEKILDILNFNEHKRAISFAFDLIALACNHLNMNWKENDDLLQKTIEYLFVYDWPKEQLGQLRKTHPDVLDSFLGMLSENLCLKNVQFGGMIINESVLSRLANPLRKSNNFQTFYFKLRKFDPAVFGQIENLSPVVEKLIALFERNSADLIPIALDLDSWFIEETLPMIAFSNDATMRSNISLAILQSIPKPKPEHEKYIRLRIIDQTLIKPKEFEENSFLHLVIGLVELGLKHQNYLENSYRCYGL